AGGNCRGRHRLQPAADQVPQCRGRPSGSREHLEGGRPPERNWALSNCARYNDAMKYFVEIEGRTIELDFQEEDELLKVAVGGRHLSLDLRQVSPPQLYSLLIDNKSYDVLVEAHDEAFDVLIGPEMFHLTVQDEWTRRLANIQRKTQVETGLTPVKAPMPGAVVAVEVEVGQEVKKGQGLVIL